VIINTVKFISISFIYSLEDFLFSTFRSNTKFIKVTKLKKNRYPTHKYKETFNATLIRFLSSGSSTIIANDQKTIYIVRQITPKLKRYFSNLIFYDLDSHPIPRSFQLTTIYPHNSSLSHLYIMYRPDIICYITAAPR